MKLDQLLGEEDLRTALTELLNPDTLRAPKAKGPDAIKVSGYLVHGHWRRRWVPPPGYHRKSHRRNAGAATYNGTRKKDTE